KLRVIHTRRTSRHASQTTEAEVHFLRKRPGRLHFPIGNRPHQRNASARTVALHLGRVVRGTRGQAKAAMHALLHDGVIQLFQVRLGSGHLLPRKGKGFLCRCKRLDKNPVYIRWSEAPAELLDCAHMTAPFFLCRELRRKLCRIRFAWTGGPKWCASCL